MVESRIAPMIGALAFGMIVGVGVIIYGVAMYYLKK